MIKVYVASKLSHSSMLRELREAWLRHGIDLHARWFEQAKYELGEENLSYNEFKIFWLVDEEDVSISKAVIVYGKKDDKLRGALVEAGMAIAQGILTIVIGEHPDYGSWQHHPMVVKADNLEHAKQMILRRFS